MALTSTNVLSSLQQQQQKKIKLSICIIRPMSPDRFFVVEKMIFCFIFWRYKRNGSNINNNKNTDSAGFWSQYLSHGKRALYHLSHSLARYLYRCWVFIPKICKHKIHSSIHTSKVSTCTYTLHLVHTYAITPQYWVPGTYLVNIAHTSTTHLYDKWQETCACIYI